MLICPTNPSIIISTMKATKKSKSTKIKIAARPLTEQQIKEFVEFYNKNKSFPGSKIPCNITGKLTTCIGPWMAKKIKEFGGPEQLLRNYKCRGAIKAEKQIIKPVSKKQPKSLGKISTKTKSKRREIIKDLKDENKNWDLPKANFEPSRPISDEDLTITTKTACLRPDIYLDNDRYCNGCEYFDVCANEMKNLFKRKVKR